MSKQAHLCKALDQQILISRCRRVQPKVSVLTWGGLKIGNEFEKSAEVIVLIEKRAVKEKQRTHKKRKD